MSDPCEMVAEEEDFFRLEASLIMSFEDRFKLCKSPCLLDVLLQL